MPKLDDFSANNVSFPESGRRDIDALVDHVPEAGTLHLAILRQPYLSLIRSGEKTIESRFNTKRAAPFGRVAMGDLVLLKETGKPVTDYFFVASVALFNLRQTRISGVRERYGEGICVQDEETFWLERTASHYATLVGVGTKGELDPFPVVKRDQRGWVAFERANTLF